MKKSIKTKLLTTVMASILFMMPATMAMATSTTQEGLVNIGDKSLYAKVVGTDNGTVSVVFDNGYGGGINEDSEHETWGTIQAEISKYAKTITYDRTGIGRSDKGTNRPALSQDEINTFINGGNITYDPATFESGTGKTSLDRARDLHALLKASAVEGPYLLVVHSISMYVAVEFAKEYPNEVAGVVSVDGTWPTAIEDADSWARKYNPEMEQLFLTQFSEADGTLSEVIQSALQVRNAGDVLRNIPLTILHPSNLGMGDEYQAMTDLAMENWAKWSNYSKLTLVPNSGHYVMGYQPQYITNAVKDMLVQLGIKVNK